MPRPPTARIVGLALAVLALATLSAFAEWQKPVNFVLGLWLIASPWALRFAEDVNAMRTQLILGILVAAVSAWAIWGHRHAPPAHA
jgi:hypothetical protein